VFAADTIHRQSQLSEAIHFTTPSSSFVPVVITPTAIRVIFFVILGKCQDNISCF
jgi:hypothetical protein